MGPKAVTKVIPQASHQAEFPRSWLVITGTQKLSGLQYATLRMLNPDYLCTVGGHGIHRSRSLDQNNQKT